MMRALRVAVVGGGSRGRGHMAILKAFPDVDLVAICDPVESARERAHDDFQVENGYGSMEDLLSHEKLDGVIVATPPDLNAAVSMISLEAGIDTLLEKPPGWSVAECVALRDAAARSGAKGMVGWNRRFDPLVIKARMMVMARGPIIQLVGEFHKNVRQIERTAGFPELVMDNLLLESPIHSIDTICALADAKVREVHSFVRRSISRYKDVHAALVVFENDCVASIVANYTAGARLERYEVHGEDISVYLEGISGGVAFCDGERIELEVDRKQSTIDQNRFFLDCVRAGRPIGPPAADLETAVETMELGVGILEGLRK